MPFIWNDSTFKDRWKEEKKFSKYLYGMIIFFAILFYFFLKEEIPFMRKLLFAFAISSVLYTIAQLIFRWPSANIPDWYHPMFQTFFRVLNVLISMGVLYFIWVQAIAEYY